MSFVKLANQYVGVEPFKPFNIALKSSGAGWETVLIEKDPNTPWYTIKAVASERFVCLNQSTKQLESRDNPNGWGGEWIVQQGHDGIWRATCDVVTLQIEGYQSTLPLSQLTINGNDFYQNGQRVSLIGCDMFLAYRQWLDGGANALIPFIAETKELVFQVWRVFMAGSVKQNTVLDLFPSRETNFYPQLKPFVKHLNDNGIIPLLTICVDMQDVMPNQSDRVNHWNRIIQEFTNSGLSVLFSYGNEADKNGFDPYEVSAPGWVWWSRGSKTQDTFYTPNGAIATEFHPVRDIEAGRPQMDAVASAFYMRDHGCGMLWLDESYPFDNNTPPHFGYDLARLYATYWALFIFHNRQGQRGLLMGAGTKECAKAAIRGNKL